MHNIIFMNCLLIPLRHFTPSPIRQTSDRRPVDGFYICFIRLPPADGEASPSSRPPGASPAASMLRRVTVLNGGAQSYELTGLRAGAAYQLFLVPFRAGREGRLSRLREVRLPEAGQCSRRPNGIRRRRYRILENRCRPDACD